MPVEAVSLSENQVQGLVWEVVELKDDFEVSRAIYGMGPEGPVYAYRRRVFAAEAFLEQNQQERNDNEGKKWSSGFGSDKNGNMPLVKVASTPLNVWFKHFKKGDVADQDKKKWFYNKEENQAFRTRKGTL